MRKGAQPLEHWQAASPLKVGASRGNFDYFRMLNRKSRQLVLLDAIQLRNKILRSKMRVTTDHLHGPMAGDS